MTLRERLPGVFLVYELPVSPGYLIGARGTVAFDYDRLDVRLEEPMTAPVTLRFRWVPGLVSDPPVSSSPWRSGRGSASSRCTRRACASSVSATRRAAGGIRPSGGRDGGARADRRR